MGQGCSKCSVGNPCTDPECSRYGSSDLKGLLEQVRDKWEDFQESVRTEEQNRKWLEDLDRRFEERKDISADGCKYYSNNVRGYFNTPQPKIGNLDNVECRLMTCLDSHKQGEYTECASYAQDLTDLATAGRDPPAHCKRKADSYKYTFASASSPRETAGGTGAKTNARANLPKSFSFGSCYS